MLVRPSVFDYFTSKITLPHKALTELVEFFLRYRSLVQPPVTSKTFFATKTMVTTPLTQIATQAIELGKDQLFALMVVPPKTVPVPEVFTFQHIPFDIKQFPPDLAAALQSYPEMRDKIVVNTTQFLKASGQFSDLTGFQNVIVRDLLTRSFATATTATWLTPRLALFVAKIYSMSLGSAIAEWFQLDARQRGIISTILAFYILQQMSSANLAEIYIRNNRKLFYLPEIPDLEQIFGLIEETVGTLSLTDTAAAYRVINAIGIPRMMINRHIVITKVQKWGPDLFTTGLALEHPAYFTYLILLCLSGAKIGLSFRLKNILNPRDSEQFVDDLRRCATFIPAL
jgi:hypothetical protein